MSQKGGVGKTSLARSLAAVCAEANLNVVLIDLDDQQHSLVEWHKVREARGVLPHLTVKAFANAPEALDAIDDGDWQVAIIDMPGRISLDTVIVARAAHLIVQPSGPTRDDLQPAIQFFHELVSIGIAKTRLVIALCRVLHKDEEKQARIYIGKTDYEVLAGSVPEKVPYRNANNIGCTLTETTDAACNKRADQLLRSIIVKIGSLANEGKKAAATKGHVA